ncbi:MAG: ankyrin repeat domain-containing protein, partial [Candidatus Babeliales bacterium]
ELLQCVAHGAPLEHQLLVDAVNNKKYESARFLMEHGVVPSNDLIRLGIRNRDLSFIDLIFSCVAQFDDAKVQQMMGMAIDANQLDLLTRLLTPDISVSEELLKQAARRGNKQIIIRLLNHPNTCSVKLCLAYFAEGGLWEFVEPYIDAGLENKEVFLRYAAGQGNVDIVKKLLHAGADINGVDTSGMTPLMHAAYNKRHDMVTLLVNFKARRDSKDISGRTALSIAMSSGTVSHSLYDYLIQPNSPFGLEQDALVGMCIDMKYTNILTQLVDQAGVNPIPQLAKKRLQQIQSIAPIHSPIWKVIQKSLKENPFKGMCLICFEEDQLLCHSVCQERGCKNDICQKCFNQLEKRGQFSKCLICRKNRMYSLEDCFHVSLSASQPQLMVHTQSTSQTQPQAPYFWSIEVSNPLDLALYFLQT